MEVKHRSNLLPWLALGTSSLPSLAPQRSPVTSSNSWHVIAPVFRPCIAIDECLVEELFVDFDAASSNIFLTESLKLTLDAPFRRKSLTYGRRCTRYEPGSFSKGSPAAYMARR